MGRNSLRWLVLALVVLAALAVGFLGYWYFQRLDSEKRRERLAAQSKEMLPLPQPPEFAEEYDPSVTVGVYRVEAVEADGVVELSYLWPSTKAGERVRSLVDCGVGDYRVFESGATVPSMVTRRAFLEVLAAQRRRVMLRGQCNDGGCTALTKNCEITITPEKLDEDS